MFDDVVQDVKAQTENIASTKMDQLTERIVRRLSGCSKRQQGGVGRVEGKPAGIEMWFRLGHAPPIDSTNAHIVSKHPQTRLLEEPCQEVKLVSEKMFRLCTLPVLWIP